MTRGRVDSRAELVSGRVDPLPSERRTNLNKCNHTEKQKRKMSSRRVLSDDLKTLEFETSEDVEVTPTFDNMGLREELLRGVYAYGILLI